jgi:NAD(P)H-hydrate epimerase
MSESMRAALIGPGISHHESTCELIRRLALSIKIPFILDADGINAFRGCVEQLKERKCNDLIITPHDGEWKRLFGELPSEPSPRIETLRSRALEYQMTILSKGNPTLVVYPDGKVFICALANSAMATAGAGDVLSGIIVSLLAQGLSPARAALLGASIHGLAGLEASRNFSEYSMIAGDIVEYIPNVLKKFSSPLPKVYLPD